MPARVSASAPLVRMCLSHVGTERYAHRKEGKTAPWQGSSEELTMFFFVKDRGEVQIKTMKGENCCTADSLA